MSKYLFLYGTLLSSHAPSEIAETVMKLRRVGRGYVHGHLYDLGEYPGAILDKSLNARISGEVYEIPDGEDVLASLDLYEEFNPARPKDSLFVRRQASVTLSNGRVLDCWVYIYNKDPGAAPLVVGGDYSKYK